MPQRQISGGFHQSRAVPVTCCTGRCPRSDLRAILFNVKPLRRRNFYQFSGRRFLMIFVRICVRPIPELQDRRKLWPQYGILPLAMAATPFRLGAGHYAATKRDPGRVRSETRPGQVPQRSGKSRSLRRSVARGVGSGKRRENPGDCRLLKNCNRHG